MIVGAGQARFEVVENWPRLPDGWSCPDVVGVAIDARDRVYAFNRGQAPSSPDHPVIVFEPDGTFAHSFGDGLFPFAHGIGLDASGNVFLGDCGTHTVRKFSVTGELLMTLGIPAIPSETGIQGSDYRTITHGSVPFNRPTRPAVAPNGDLYVSDGYGNARIHHFAADGTLKASWGEPGDGPGQFNVPHSVWVHTDGRVFVCDRENSRVQVFTAEGAFLAQWTDVIRPDDLYIDREGLVYIAELGERAGLFPFMSRPLGHDRPGRVSVFDLDGQLVARWGGDDPYAPGSFFAPHGIAVDSRGDLYVSEVVASGGGLDGLVELSVHSLQKFRRVA